MSERLLHSRPRPLTQLVNAERAHAVVEWALLAGGAVTLFMLPHVILGDGIERFRAIEQLATSGTVGSGRYSLVGPLFSLPLYWLGKVVWTPEWWCARFNFFVFAFGLAALCRILHGRVPPALLRRILILLAVASMFPNNVEGYYGEVFTAVFVGVGLLAVCFGRSYSGWSAVVLGVVNTPATLGGLAVVTSVRCLQTKRLRHAIPLFSAAGLVMIESWVRRGGPFVTGYEGDHGPQTALPYSGLPGFSYPFLLGLLSILFSFGKSLFLFASGLLLGGLERIRTVSERLYQSQRLWLATLVGLVFVYSKWWAWYGGFCWGPRFFLVAALPAAVCIAIRMNPAAEAPLHVDIATLAVLAWSVWVGVSGAVFGNDTLGNTCVANGYALESFCWYLPEYSPLFWPFISRRELSLGELATLGYGAVAFAVLATPLLIRVAVDGARVVREVTRGVFDGSRWRV